MPTLDVTGRCDLGFNTAAFDDVVATARLHAHGHEHAEVDDLANPSGRVDLTLEEWASTFTDESLGMDVGEVVPGCEGDWGMFSGANPGLPYMPSDIPSVASFASGRDSGATIADPLDLDGRGDGPGLS